MKITWLMVCKEDASVYYENHKKRTVAQCRDFYGKTSDACNRCVQPILPVRAV
jgi:hypothetical protein